MLRVFFFFLFFRCQLVNKDLNIHWCVPDKMFSLFNVDTEKDNDNSFLFTSKYFVNDIKSSLDAESSSSVGSGCSRAGTCSRSSGCVNRSGIKVSRGSVVAYIQSVVPSIALVLDDSATNEVRVSPHHLRVVADRGEIGTGPRFVF